MHTPTLFDPTEEHAMLRQMVREFTVNEVEPQAALHDEKGVLNVPLLEQLGEVLIAAVSDVVGKR